MQRPSEKALQLGEELVDHVRYGLTRYDTVAELAELADEANGELRAAVRAVLEDAQRNGGVPTAVHLAHLRQVLSDYEPSPPPADSQGELVGLGAHAQPRLL